MAMVLSGHKGWNDFEHYNDANQIRQLIREKATYLLLGNPDLKQAPHLQPLPTDSVGMFESAPIYKLHTKK